VTIGQYSYVGRGRRMLLDCDVSRSRFDADIHVYRRGWMKKREWKNRHGRKCEGGKYESGNTGTAMQRCNKRE